MATCPECDAEILIDDDDLEDMEVGDPWDCDECASHLRVAILRPLEFDVDDEDEEEDDEKEKSDDAEVTDEIEDDDDDDKDDGNWDE